MKQQKKLILLSCSIIILTTGIAYGQKANSKIPADLLDILRRDFDGDCMRDYSSGYKDFAKKFLKGQSVILDTQKSPAFIIYAAGPCYGASGTQVWIYRRVGKNWHELLNEPGNQQIVTLAKTSSNGVRDVTIDVGTWRERLLTKYKFNGSKYSRSPGCIHKLFGYVDNGGNWRAFKAPKIKHDCDFEY